ncbi:MAG: PAS domain-containing sensor histidine kinase [Bacteroidia bacterium]|nr:PAS domain-containing sensor histidine kinase [Bacteroidia bacterium]NND10137.1 PAS domain-containing sensor histidine kinase [Flavobacteriaceae bacterium]NNK28930.1 PAS domain-containing sensor histidine kinase [Flavobacteriaceae bacterium]RZV61282.1 MAG: PAS domain S-box protein [Flavobacteriaceae bacterium]
MKSPKESDAYFNKLKWQFALENSGLGIWDWNSVSNKVYYSKESRQILGLKEKEMKSTSEAWDERVHPDDREQYFKDFEDHVKGKTSFYINEHRVRCEDGSYKWILDRGKILLKDSNGKPLRIIGTHSDISKRKNAENQTLNNLDIITSQNKKLLNFAHIVSHNLRTHVGNFETIMKFYDEAASKEEKEEMIMHLKTISRSLSSTIGNLDDVVREVQMDKESLKTGQLNLMDYLSRALEVLKADIEDYDATVNLMVDEATFVNFLPAYLESILQNILSNAIKYRKQNTSLIIDISSENLEDAIKLSIRDNGIGIDLEKYGEQLFGMYNTFHNQSGVDSRGIGLYLTRSQLETFGGSIEVESELGKGSTFILTFKK